MREAANIETVRGIFAAFGRRDLDGVLARLDETIVWIVPGSSAVPTAGRWNGIAEVREFLERLAERLTFTVFTPLEYIAQGNRVIALVRYGGRHNATGRAFKAESAMLWTIGNGKALRFQEYTDTEALALAARDSELQTHGAGSAK
jgi:ketosteroid isomerase-like protein